MTAVFYLSNMKHGVRLLLCLIFVVGTDAYAQRQGIKGEVFWLGGNQMPALGRQSSDPDQGVVREILFYEATHLKDVDQIADGLFTNVKTKLIATARSLPDGSFTIRLPPGEYSVFVKETGGLFANLVDRTNTLNPVTVKPKQYAWLTITIDYEMVN